MDANREALRPISKKEAMTCIVIRRGFVRNCEVLPGGIVKKYPISRAACEQLVEAAAQNGLVCICNDAATPGYAVVAYNTHRGLWQRFESDIASVTALETACRSRPVRPAS